MKSSIREEIERIFKANGGYVRTRDITGRGIHNIYLQELLNEGTIEKVKQGLYRWEDMIDNSNSSLIEVSLAIPQGVICLLYALAYHKLTTQKSWEVSVAIERGSRVSLPEYPPVKLYYFSSSMFNEGIEKIREGKHVIRIYNKEKTICDCMRFRNQLGKDIIKEMMVEYLRNSNRNLELLMKYAALCRVTNPIRNYLEVLM
jgi:predicted transcriptional regulator of viral defense system